MRQTGAPDPIYVEARRLLLDVLDKLGAAKSGAILVGAQAVHLNVEPDPLPLVAYTIDGDLALDPRDMPKDPRLAAALRAAGLERSGQPGIWWPVKAASEVKPSIDLLVPAVFSPMPDKRGADLDGQEENAARYVSGLEAALVDWSVRTIGALDPGDRRTFSVRVARPAALVIAKVHKLRDRLADSRRPDRVDPKDAYEVVRLLQLPMGVLVQGWAAALGDDISRPIALAGIGLLEEQFGTPDAAGSRLAGEYVAELTDQASIRASAAALAVDLINALREAGL